MIKNLEKKNSDLKDWEKFLENPGTIHNKDNDKVEDLNLNKKFRFDLHGYSIEKANSIIDQIISNCYKNGVQQILLITGKGIHSKNESNVFVSSEYSKLKKTIPLFIKNKPELASKIKKITTAPTEQGGEVALIIKLKKLTK